MKSNNKHQLSPEGQYLMDYFTRKLNELKKEIKSTLPEKDYYRTTEVCKILGISRSKFEQFKRDGLFPTHKIGGMVYVAATDIKRLRPSTSRS